jgi:UPF0716 protein FxsA
MLHYTDSCFVKEKCLMPFIVLLLFPAVEIYLLIKIGAEIGALAVIVWLVGTAFFGVNILRYLGTTAMLNAARQMRTGTAPAHTLADALVKAIAALLLIIPGFVTDFLALLLFIPPLRYWLIKRWLRKFALKSSMGAASFGAANFDPSGFDTSRVDASGFEGNIYEHQGAPNKETGSSATSGRILAHVPDKKA